MRANIIGLLTATLCIGVVPTASATSQDQGGLSTFKEKLSYSVGQQIGSNLKRDQLDLNIAVVADGVQDAFSGAPSLLTMDEMRETLIAFQKQQEAEKAAWAKAEGEKNRRDGKAFLAKNKTAKGVVTTASGLQYKVVRKGDGARPRPGDEVKVHYRGMLLDGVEFDSSYNAGEPTVFGLDSVIPGWKEGLQLMPLGSKYIFYIPASLAYGERGAGKVIGPDATLTFEVELLDIRTALR